MALSDHQLFGALFLLPFIETGELEQVAEAANGVGLSMAESPPQFDRPMGFSLLTGVLVAFERH